MTQWNDYECIVTGLTCSGCKLFCEKRRNKAYGNGYGSNCNSGIHSIDQHVGEDTMEPRIKRRKGHKCNLCANVQETLQSMEIDGEVKWVCDRCYKKNKD